MGATLTKVLPLALGAAISPVILLLQVATLASRPRPLLRALIVLLATATVTAGVVLVVILADHHTRTVPGGNETVGGWIKIVLAVVLLATALRSLLEPAPHESTRPAPDPGTGRLHPIRFYLLGVAAMATNLTTIVLLVPAVHDVAVAPISDGDRLSVILIVAAITLLPAYLPIVVVLALGPRGPVALAALSNWLHRHQRTIGIVVALGFAAYFAISGFAAIT